MKYFSKHDIDEMKKNGYDTISVSAAVQLNTEADAVIDHIIHAFEGVELGDGIGLYQAQAIDGYRSKNDIEIERARDEKSDWKRIPSKVLNECYSSLSFFDGAGMRFHIPAFLIADLKGQYNFDTVYHLIDQGELHSKQYSSLNPIQKRAIIYFLEYAISTPDYEGYCDRVIAAIESFWLR